MDIYYGDIQITNTALPHYIRLACHELGTDCRILPPIRFVTLPSTPKQTYPPTDMPSPQIPTTEQSTLLAVHTSDSKFHNNIGGGVNIELYKGYRNTKYQVIIHFKETKAQLEVV